MLQIFGNSAMGNLIQGFRMIFNPEGVKREQIIQRAQEDPTFLQSMAEARRQILENMDVNEAGNANVDVSAPLLSGLGLDPSNPENRVLLDSIEALSPRTFEQDLDQELVQRGAADVVAPARIETARTAEQTALSEREKQRNIQRFQERRGQIGAPEREAELSLEGTEQQVRHLQQRTMLNNFGLSDAALQDKIIRGYDAYRDTLPPEMQGIADTAFRNPNFLRHLQFMEELDLRGKMQMAKQSEDAVKMQTARIGLYSDVREELEGAVEFINNPEIDESVKRAQIRRWNDMQLDLERNGFSGPAGMFSPVMLLAKKKGIFGGDVEAGAATVGDPPPTRGPVPQSEGERRALSREEAIIDPTREDLLEIAREQGVDRAIAVLQDNSPEMKAFRQLLEQRGELVELRRDLAKIKIIEESGYGGDPSAEFGGGGFNFGVDIEPVEID